MSSKRRRLGRRTPYTEIGAARMRCSRYSLCGNRARLQWGTCAIDNRWVVLCCACDLELNRLALVYMMPDDPDGVAAAVERYRQRLLRHYGPDCLRTREGAA